jgi:hypothetical protein
MLPITAKLVGDGGLLGTTQSHDVIASLRHVAQAPLAARDRLPVNLE